MKKKWLLLITIIFSLSLGFTSCSDDDDKSSAANITSFTFDTEEVVEHTLVVGTPEIKESEIWVTVSSKATEVELKKFKPTIELSAGATISPASGVAQDFSKEVTYTVTAEDGVTKKVYTVKTQLLEISEAIYGVYLGEIKSILVNDEPIINEPIKEKVYLAQNEEGYSTFELKDFSIALGGEMLELGTIELDRVDLWNTGTQYEFEGKETLSLAVGECDTELEGSISADHAIKWTVNVNVVEPSGEELEVKVLFEGELIPEDLSSTVKLESFKIDSDLIYQEAKIDAKNKKITVFIANRATEDELKSLVPTLVVADNGTVSPESGVAQDFTQAIEYTITSADGINQEVYTITVERASRPEIKEITFTSSSTNSNRFVEEKARIEGDNIFITVSGLATPYDLKNLVPSFSLPYDLKSEPASGAKVDFNAPVVYRVTAADGEVKEYAVTIIKSEIEIPLYFDFEAWVKEDTVPNSGKDYFKPAGIWATSNPGAAMLVGMGNADRFVVEKSNDSKAGASAAKIVTLQTQSDEKPVLTTLIPKVTTGSLFLGEFVLDYLDQLNSTKFGIPYSEKPIRVKGYYKYTPGEKYYEVKKGDKKGDPTFVEGKLDQCAIRVILFEAGKGQLTGKNIGKTDLYVASGELTSEGAASYTSFDIPLTYHKAYDSSKEYYLTLIFTSSKDGDKFSGAPGSELFIDEVEIVNE